MSYSVNIIEGDGDTITTANVSFYGDFTAAYDSVIEHIKSAWKDTNFTPDKIFKMAQKKQFRYGNSWFFFKIAKMPTFRYFRTTRENRQTWVVQQDNSREHELRFINVAHARRYTKTLNDPTDEKYASRMADFLADVED